MWFKVICLAVALVTMAPQGSAQNEPGLAQSFLDFILRRIPPDTCCSGPHCNGQCYFGYCAYPLVPALSAYCRCPKGMMCCVRKVAPTKCRLCNPNAKCVPLDVPCSSLTLDPRKCACPRGQKCCTGPFCFECGGRCMPRRQCRRPYYQIASEKCPCPHGMVCCKRQTCGYTETCARGVCVPNKEKCLNLFPVPWVSEPFPLLVKGCTCPPFQKCCRFDCARCGGMCIRKQCPSHMKPLPSNKCPCREGFVCCIGNCPYPPCMPAADCIRKLGGWVIPATNCPRGRVCCQRPTCEKYCKNASCVSIRRCVKPNIIISKSCRCPPGKVCCRMACTMAPCYAKCVKGVCDGRIHVQSMHPLKCPCPDGFSCCKEATCSKNCPGARCQSIRLPCAYPINSEKCTCPAGQRCCRYLCTQSSCRGVCIRGPCRSPMKSKPKPCNCPLGYSCCTAPCRYPPCITIDECKRARGLPVFSTDCPKGRVCCRGSSKCPHPCVSAVNCKLSGGVPVPSANCAFGLVCCRINAPRCPYPCVSALRCKSLGGQPIASANCFRPLYCCKYKIIKPKCPYSCIHHTTCSKLGGRAVISSDCVYPNNCCIFGVLEVPKCAAVCRTPEDCVKYRGKAVTASGCPVGKICCQPGKLPVDIRKEAQKPSEKEAKP